MNDESVKVTITLPRSFLQSLDEIADDKTLSRSALIRMAVSEYIKKERTRELRIGIKNSNL